MASELVYGSVGLSGQWLTAGEGSQWVRRTVQPCEALEEGLAEVLSEVRWGRSGGSRARVQCGLSRVLGSRVRVVQLRLHRRIRPDNLELKYLRREGRGRCW